MQRYKIRHINKIILGIKNSVIDSEIKNKEFTKAIGRQNFYVKGYLTWSEENYLEVPGRTQLSYDGVEDNSPYNWCYFSIDEKYTTISKDWSLKESRVIKLNLPDLIRFRYNRMIIFPGDLVHAGGFNDTSLNGNFCI